MASYRSPTARGAKQDEHTKCIGSASSLSSVCVCLCLWLAGWMDGRQLVDRKGRLIGGQVVTIKLCVVCNPI